MKEKDDLQWSELFLDKPVPKTILEDLHAQLMTQISAYPVDFEAEIRLAARRKWGLGLTLSLMLAGLMFWLVLWLGRDMLYQWLDLPSIMLNYIPYVSKIQQFGQQILYSFMSITNLKTEIDFLWGVVSWPILGIMCVIVVFRNPNHLNN